MAYINAFVTHFRAVQEWGIRTQASVNLDVVSFELEVKCRSRYYTFFPQFVATFDGRIANMETLAPNTGGFAGWLPYRPLAYELSQDKLQFKRFAASAGVKAPAQWLLDNPGQVPDKDYILKRSSGSYGHELSGPFKAGTLPAAQTQPQGQQRGTLYAEEFIRGRSLKVWCWGQRPFFAYVRRASALAGDGISTMQQLIEMHLAKAGLKFDGYKELHVLRDCLAYQGLSLHDVPRQGSAAFIDFRYGRENLDRRGLQSDNELPKLEERTRVKIDQMAKTMASALRAVLPAPVVYSLDGVIDDSGEVWWLEINSNPTLPPEGYGEMFADLFGV
jgi:hypothetical protein